MEHQIPILCRNLTHLKFNFNFVIYVWAVSVIGAVRAESKYAYRIKCPFSYTGSFKIVDINYKTEMTGRL
jgi:hypothetical protein